jgi:exosortase E/protease (VPEID-CTERM system)
MGGMLGTYLWLLIGMFVRQEAPLAQKPLWGYLSDVTLRLVSWLLGWIYSGVVYESAENLVGTDAFQVGISYACSGIEGISLITLFLLIYLWLFRNELRFPQALWLFPLGMLAMWLSNALRIAMLIVIGSEIDSKIALGGFHAQAGWIAFVLIALGLIAAAHKTTYFAREATDRVPKGRHASLAEALLVPLLALMAASAMTSAISAGFDRLYWVRALVAAMALWYYRKAYRGLGWSLSWQAVGIGVLVFAVWMLLEPATDDSQTELARGLAALSSGAAAAWITFRVLGSVLIVPVVEELAFRGYLLRKFIAPNFEDVRLGQLTVFSWFASSALFGFLHGRWLAGTLAGMLYALAVYRRGQIGDAVLAHTTTNALIAAWVVKTGRWGLW